MHPHVPGVFPGGGVRTVGQIFRASAVGHGVIDNVGFLRGQGIPAVGLPTNRCSTKSGGAWGAPPRQSSGCRRKLGLSPCCSWCRLRSPCHCSTRAAWWWCCPSYRRHRYRWCRCRCRRSSRRTNRRCRCHRWHRGPDHRRRRPNPRCPIRCSAAGAAVAAVVAAAIPAAAFAAVVIREGGRYRDRRGGGEQREGPEAHGGEKFAAIDHGLLLVAVVRPQGRRCLDYGVTIAFIPCLQRRDRRRKLADLRWKGCGKPALVSAGWDRRA